MCTLRSRIAFALLCFVLAFPFAAVMAVTAGPPASDPTPTPGGRIASQQELAAAFAAWERSEHAHTFDDGQGANTTCARCKSPLNWDPAQVAAQELAVDCGSCKRVPGAPRPELSGGAPVAEEEWAHISCEVCHMPAGDSYYVEPAFWNQALKRYEAVENSTELCAHCHEGQHGFEVVDEQTESAVHRGMSCIDCHGAHNEPVTCQECHHSAAVSQQPEHLRHPGVHCSGCHDAGALTIWQDPEPGSDYYQQFITRRFAHTLTSWPSHNLSAAVDCLRCHHPQGDRAAVVVEELSCTICHEHAYGAVSEWCIFFNRDPAPNGEESYADDWP